MSKIHENGVGVGKNSWGLDGYGDKLFCIVTF